jgi:hypothetical protein
MQLAPSLSRRVPRHELPLAVESQGPVCVQVLPSHFVNQCAWYMRSPDLGAGETKLCEPCEGDSTLGEKPFDAHLLREFQL